MRILIEYYPDAEDNLDVEAQEPTGRATAPSFSMAADELARLEQLHRKIERESETEV